MRALRWVGGALFVAGFIFGGSLVSATADHLPTSAVVVILLAGCVLVVSCDLWDAVLADEAAPHRKDATQLIGLGGQRGCRPSGEVLGTRVQPRPRLTVHHRPRPVLFDAVADDPRLADTMGELA